MERMPLPAIVVLVILGLVLFWQIASRLLRKFRHVPAPSWLGYLLDSDLRRLMQPPDRIIARSGIKSGMRVMELGCGSGAYTTFVARAVGTDGKVYGVDIQQDMLRQLRRKLAKAENRNITNIEMVQASAYNLPFAGSSLDLVYMVTVLHEIPDRVLAMKEIRRVLRPGGLLAVSEFLPDPDYAWRSTTIRLGGQAGFALDTSSGNLWTYTVRFKKPASPPEPVTGKDN